MTNLDDDREPARPAKPPLFSSSMEPTMVLHLCGELDLASVPAMKAALEPMTTTDGPITVDLADVTFIDSSALHVLLDTAHRTGQEGPIVVLRASAAVRRVLDLTGAGALFDHR